MTIAASPAALIETHFGALKDPRATYRIEHKLIDILTITICATICGANDWEAIAQYGRTKQDWLKTWLELPNGIPSSDTFNRVFARLKPEELQKCFIEQGADYILALKGNQGNLHTKESKVGVKTRRLQAGWDDNYLKTVLSALNIVTS